MKTIKIPEELHRDLRIIQAKYGLKTIPNTIRFLYCYHEAKEEENEYDKSKK